MVPRRYTGLERSNSESSSNAYHIHSFTGDSFLSVVGSQHIPTETFPDPNSSAGMVLVGGDPFTVKV